MGTQLRRANHPQLSPLGPNDARVPSPGLRCLRLNFLLDVDRPPRHIPRSSSQRLLPRKGPRPLKFDQLANLRRIDNSSSRTCNRLSRRIFRKSAIWRAARSCPHTRPPSKVGALRASQGRSAPARIRPVQPQRSRRYGAAS